MKLFIPQPSEAVLNLPFTFGDSLLVIVLEYVTNK